MKNQNAVKLGEMTSEAKASAARTNGSLGGRPIGSKDKKPRKPASRANGKLGGAGAWKKEKKQ